MKFRTIQRFTRNPNYQIHVSWESLIEQLEHWTNERLAPLDLNPEFQREYVWTEEQKIAYIEFKLKGGQGSDRIYFNCVGWGFTFDGPFVLVDGKQRISAVLNFINGKIPAFGHYFSEFEDKIPFEIGFIFCVNDLKTEKEVLQWYIDMNTGGTVHTKEEIEKVKNMIENIN